ncbi:MAG TPA: HAD family hydrolase [Kofleriaceae bacterium]|nr:HAD family hydrolase [Kofleriaceae bacterium]
MLYLFDIDGTLLLSGGAGARALEGAFAARYGLAGAMEGVQLGGKTDPNIVEEVFLARLGRRPSQMEIDDILDLYLPRLRAELAAATRFHLMPSVVETLDHLAGLPGVRLGLATGNIRAGAQAKLERGGLWHRFELGGFACDHRDRDRLVARAIERAGGVSPDEVVVVGDTPFDVAAARACGARVLAVATGSVGKGALAACQPDAVFDTLAELPAWHAAQVARRSGPKKSDSP